MKENSRIEHIANSENKLLGNLYECIVIFRLSHFAHICEVF